VFNISYLILSMLDFSEFIVQIHCSQKNLKWKLLLYLGLSVFFYGQVSLLSYKRISLFFLIKFVLIVTQHIIIISMYKNVPGMFQSKMNASCCFHLGTEAELEDDKPNWTYHTCTF
jgi:hypothetical protein